MSQRVTDGRADDLVAWRAYTGERAVVHAREGSYAARRAQAELRAADRAAAALEKLLQPAPERRAGRLEIVLTDPAAELPASIGSIAGNGHQELVLPATAGTPIVRVVRPDAPGEPLIVAVTRALVARWFGASAAGATAFVDGLAGVIGAQVGDGPTVKEADAWVRGELAARRPVSVVARAEEPADPRAATSFVAYLIQNSGTDAFRRFLADYDPGRRDQAAGTAFQRPLGGLEEAWLAGLRRERRGSAFGPFFRHLTPLLHPYLWREGEVLFYMILGLSYTLALPLATKYVIDMLIPSGNVSRLVIFILALLGVYLLDAAIGMRRAYVNSWINQRVVLDLQERMFAHLQRLSHKFYGETKVGDIMSRLSSDLQIVQVALSQVAGVGIYLALRALVAGVAVIALSPLLGLIVIVVVPLFALTYFALRTRLQQASIQLQKLVGEVQATAQENIGAHAVIKAFTMEDRAIASYRGRLQALFRVLLRLIVIATVFETSTGLAVSMGQLIVLGVGGYLVIQGAVTIGTLLAFIGLLPSLIEPVASLSNLGQTMQRASGAFDRVGELLDEPITVADQPGATTLPPLREAITLEGVEFSYDGDRPILRGLDLAIPAGQHVAIVGPSGSGKSTIINLLLRFWDPDAGRVLFDGRDLRGATLRSLREQVGIVFQDTFIFDTTLRENIALARPEATDAEIAAVARAAQLDGYVATLPAGFDTVLGERGVRMSGGQRQRLAIARALLRDPRLLILDEATSALDAQTEREVLETFARVAHGRTTVSITHRLALAAQADRIVVLEAGRLVEQGTHNELVAAGGLYQRLYEEQTGATIGARRVEIEAARLRAIPLFAGLSAEGLGGLAERLAVERFAADENVVRQGEAGDKLYIINRGQVEVLVGAEERRVNTLNEGDYFGEMALLTGEPRTATVRTTAPAELFSLAQADFAALLERDAPVRRAVAETVAGRRVALSAVATQG